MAGSPSFCKHHGATRVLIAATLLCSLVWLLAHAGPAWAGEKISVECSNPGCGYTNNLSLGGARRSPAITCYCAQCRDFIRIKLQNWDQYYDQVYTCPKCGLAALPTYSQEDIRKLPCPGCGQKTLKTKILMRYD